MRKLFAALCLALAGLMLTTAHAAANQDSEAVTGAPAQPASNCPNIDTQWYGAGVVPPGYYKSNSDGNCYPISACDAGTTWSSTTQTCVSVCSSNTVWLGSSCGCPAGLPNWNGSSCVAACPAGSTFNGSGCSANACAATNGTSGACSYSFPPTASGSRYTASNTSTGYTGSATAACSSGAWTTTAASCAANTCAPQGVSSGGCSYTLPTTASGSVGSASNVAGGYTGSASATCSAGTWSGVSASCVAQPPVVSLAVNGSSAPTTVTSGSGIPLAWSATNAPSSIVINCGAFGSWSGATNPGSSVTAATTDVEVGLGQQTCVATASNAGGTASSNSVPLTVACPSTKYYDSTAHACDLLPFASGGAGVAGSYGWFTTTLALSGTITFQLNVNGTWSVVHSGFPAGHASGSPTSGTWTLDPSQVYEYTITTAHASLGTVIPSTTTTTWTTLGSMSFMAKTSGGGVPEGDGTWTINIRKKGTTSPVETIAFELDVANGD